MVGAQAGGGGLVPGGGPGSGMFPPRVEEAGAGGGNSRGGADYFYPRRAVRVVRGFPAPGVTRGGGCGPRRAPVFKPRVQGDTARHGNGRAGHHHQSTRHHHWALAAAGTRTARGGTQKSGAPGARSARCPLPDAPVHRLSSRTRCRRRGSTEAGGISLSRSMGIDS